VELLSKDYVKYLWPLKSLCGLFDKVKHVLMKLIWEVNLPDMSHSADNKYSKMIQFFMTEMEVILWGGKEKVFPS
jgi:hypothetical protein